MPKKSIEIEWHADNVIEIFNNESRGQQIVQLEPLIQITERINFADDKWDFTELVMYHNKSDCYNYNFQHIKTSKYRIYLKRMILRLAFMKRLRFTTIKVHTLNILKLIEFLESNYYIDPNIISSKIIKKFVEEESKRVSEQTKRRILTSIKKFLIELEFNGVEIYLSDYVDVLNNYSLRKINQQIELGKTPNIPRKTLNRIIQLALNDINDLNLNIIDRMIACLILLISQIGMRRGEALILEIDRLKPITILNGAKTAYYLEFFSYKTKLSDGKWTEARMNDLSMHAYNSLIEIAKDRRINNSIVLYPNLEGEIYTSTTLTSHFKRFFARHQNQLAIHLLSQNDLEKLNEWVIKENELKEFNSFLSKADLGKKFYRVNPHQFRVAVANELRKDVDLQWIKEHMNHLLEDMTKHYFRDDDKVKETLLVRSSKDGTKLENNPGLVHNEEILQELDDPYYVEAYEKINKFLTKNKLNIYDDLDEIINVFKKTPIRDTELGFCTKVMGILCERQDKLTTLEKWYYVRPQFTDLSNFDFTYIRFTEKVKLVKHSEEIFKENPKYQRQYELELKSLESFYENKFLPEFKMLKKEIQEIGKENIYKKYPNLQKVIPILIEIETEAQQWWEKRKSLVL